MLVLDAAGWRAPAPDAAGRTEDGRSVRSIGAAVGTLISVAIAGVGHLLDGAGPIHVDELASLSSPAGLGALGIPIAALLGWLLAPRAIRGDRTGAFWTALLFATLAIVLGAYETVGLWLVVFGFGAPGDLGAGLTVFAFVPLLGILFLGPLIFPLLVAAALAWSWVVRRLAR